MTVVQPANAEETRALLRWAVEDAEENVAIRLAIGPSPRRIELPTASSSLGAARSCARATDALLFAYGPVMLHEALTAAELLAGDAARRGRRRHAVAEPRRPGLARRASSTGDERAFVLEDHAPVGGLGDALRRELRRARPLHRRSASRAGPPAARRRRRSRFHGLDGASLADADRGRALGAAVL